VLHGNKVQPDEYNTSRLLGKDFCATSLAQKCWQVMVVALLGGTASPPVEVLVVVPGE
jgi:hypothetical protein